MPSPAATAARCSKPATRAIAAWASSSLSPQPVRRKPERGGWAERIRQFLETGRAAIVGDGVGTLPTDTEPDESDVPLREDV